MVRVVEGGTELEVPTVGSPRGPKPRAGGLFYNPAMRVSRDVSVAVAAVRARGRRTFHVLDGLAAIGARGLRLANEIPRAKVMLNDIDPRAAAWTRRNLRRLPHAKVDVRTGPFESAALEGPFDWVDVDPYGSPARFLPAAITGVRSGGTLAATATDTATLCGVRAEACRRRYDAVPLRCAFSHELAVRILAGSVARLAARVDRAAVPVLAHASDHFVRCYFEVRDGAKRADAALKMVGFAWLRGDGTRGVGAERPVDALTAGPIWTGAIQAEALAKAARSEAERRGLSYDAIQLLTRLEAEAPAPPLYTTVAEVARALRTGPPAMAPWLARLRDEGLGGWRTHFDPQGIKSRATFSELVEAARRG